jgi:hypothetical protein
MATTASPAPNNPPMTGTPLLTAPPIAAAELATEAPVLVIVLAAPSTPLVTTVATLPAPLVSRDIRRHTADAARHHRYQTPPLLVTTVYTLFTPDMMPDATLPPALVTTV